MISDPLSVFLVLAGVVFLAVYLEARVPALRALGAALLGILIGMVLSNAGLLPDTSPTYDFLMGKGVSFGIVLILLNVDVRSIAQAGPRMLAAFGIGAMGTAIGAIVSALAFSTFVGPETWKLAGQFTGTYTGGGMNFAILGQAFDTSSDMFSAATAADVIVTAVWMAACLTVPVLLRRKHDEPTSPSTDADAPPADTPFTMEQALHHSGRRVTIADAAALTTIAVGAVWGADRLAELLPTFPAVLWLTTITLAVAQIPAIKRLAGGALLGNYLVLLFLASNGARSVIANIVEVGPAVFYFATMTVVIHGLVIFGVGRLARIDYATLAVASQANVGGTASAMALASARGYGESLLPGVAVGLLGYAVGNYSGYAVAAIVQTWIG